MINMAHQLPQQQQNWHSWKKREIRGNVVKESNASLIFAKRKIYTVDRTEKSQTFPEKVDTSKNNKNETVYKADKSKSIPITNLSNKRTQIEKTSEINIHREIRMLLICLDKGKVSQVKHKIIFVFLARLK